MITALCIVLAFVAFYLYNTRSFNYWKDRGVKYVKPMFIFGSILDLYLLRKNVSQFAREIYYAYPKEKVVGLFWNSTPELIIRDPEVVKRVLITDFVYFHERGLHPDKYHMEPLLKNLFFAEGDLWRLLRQRITPAFTSGKLKAMFPLIVERAEHLQARTLAAARAQQSLDARDLMARYTTDFIGACGFGLDADSLNEEDSAFRKLGNEIFEFSIRTYIVAFLKDTFPMLTRKLKYMSLVEDRLVSLVRDILRQRNDQPSDRNDFIDLLLECQRKGIIEVDSLEKSKPDGTPERVSLELTDALIAAQVFVFFAAGFETSSSATSFTLHQLAFNPEVQRKVQNNIDAVLSKHDNKLSYDAVKEMTYLEWTFNEGMRMFPSLGYLSRACTRKYTFPELDLTIDEGTRIVIPLQALHMDPEYFDNPNEFRPERFSPENYSESNKYVYLPFGEGPRACIGARLGLMQSIAGMAAILSRFDIEPAPESQKVPSIKPMIEVVQSIEKGLPLIFRERKKHI